jgi:hypothetical protein
MQIDEVKDNVFGIDHAAPPDMFHVENNFPIDFKLAPSKYSVHICGECLWLNVDRAAEFLFNKKTQREMWEVKRAELSLILRRKLVQNYFRGLKT